MDLNYHFRLLLNNLLILKYNAEKNYVYWSWMFNVCFSSKLVAICVLLGNRCLGDAAVVSTLPSIALWLDINRVAGCSDYNSKYQLWVLLLWANTQGEKSINMIVSCRWVQLMLRYDWVPWVQLVLRYDWVPWVQLMLIYNWVPSEYSQC